VNECVGEGNRDCHHKGDDRAKCQEERLRVDRSDVVPSHVQTTERNENSEDDKPDQLHDDHGLHGVVEEIAGEGFHFSSDLKFWLMMLVSSSVISMRVLLRAESLSAHTATS